VGKWEMWRKWGNAERVGGMDVQAHHPYYSPMQA
jgi:hypothetical protein